MKKNLFILATALTCLAAVNSPTALEASTSEAAKGNFALVQRPSMIVVGIECRTSNDFDAGPKDIPLHWEKFNQEKISDRVLNKTSDEVIALYCDYEGDYTKSYAFVIGHQVSSMEEIPEGMVAKVLPATTYAVYTSEDTMGVFPVWLEVWQANLPRSYTGDFEVYGSKKEVDIFVALKNVSSEG